MDNNEIVIDIESTGDTTVSSHLLESSQTHDQMMTATEEPSWSGPLFNALRWPGDWNAIELILNHEPEAINGRVGPTKDTPLVIAVKQGSNSQIIENLINRTPPEKLTYSDGERKKSAIHWAAYNENFSAAQLLMSKNPTMLNCVEAGNTTPIHLALIHDARDMAYFLLKLASTLPHEESNLTDKTIKNLLRHANMNWMYDFTCILIQQYPRLAKDEYPWKMLVERQDDDYFPCPSKFNMLQSVIYSRFRIDATTVLEDLNREWEKANNRVTSTIYTRSEVPAISLCLQVSVIDDIRMTKLRHYQALEFVRRLCVEINKSSDATDHSNIVREMLFSALHNGMLDIVEVILDIIPGAIEYIDDEGNNVSHLAASNRSYGMAFFAQCQRRSRLNSNGLMSRNYSGHTVMHLVAKREQRNRFDTSSGKVLQLQYDFQRYKDLEKLLPYEMKFEKNCAEKLPMEVFDEEHRDMLKSESDWILSMASSSMVAGSLISAVVFAAAITLPGGNKDDGFPNFSKTVAFKVFALSDAVSLVSSLTAVVTFLSIFTTRYSVESFEYDLPNRLIIGLISLLISVTFMMIAFCATAYLLFSQDYDWIIYPTVVVSFVPVFFFAYLQLPSLLDIIKSTYGRNIFNADKVRPSKKTTKIYWR